MDFALISLLAVAAVLGFAVLVARAHPGSGADLLDWRPARSYEDEIALELEDVEQMIEAQNERRRRTGRPEIDEDEFRRQVAQEQNEASGPPAGPGGLGAL